MFSAVFSKRMLDVLMDKPVTAAMDAEELAHDAGKAGVFFGRTERNRLVALRMVYASQQPEHYGVPNPERSDA